MVALGRVFFTKLVYDNLPHYIHAGWVGKGTRRCGGQTVLQYGTSAVLSGRTFHIGKSLVFEGAPFGIPQNGFERSF